MTTKQTGVYWLSAVLPYRLERSGGWWVAKCGLLHIANQGKTEKSAERNLKHAIALKIQVELEKGTLYEDLKASGFHRVRVGHRTTWAAPSDEEETHQLSMRATLRTKRKPPSEQPIARENVPNLLPWTIDWKASGSGHRRSRVA